MRKCLNDFFISLYGKTLKSKLFARGRKKPFATKYENCHSFLIDMKGQKIIHAGINPDGEFCLYFEFKEFIYEARVTYDAILEVE